MSAFPTGQADAIDKLVTANRAKTPPEVVGRRAVPRSSIAELNAMDTDAIRERWASTRRDDRGPVEKFIDLVDVPRNQLLSTLAPGLERKARESGAVGAFGTGRVMFSDVLGEMGVKPGTARGVVGFVGDLAFDPLTYIGPAGWGAKLTTGGGRAVQVSARGVRALRRAERGGAADDAVRGLMDAAGGAGGLRSAVLGGVTAGAKRPLSRAMRIIGGETERSGGLIARYADEVAMAGDPPEAAQRIRAVNDFLARYGRGTGRGIRIGPKATSQVAHVPFTDVGLFVPAFTPEARAAARTLALAKTAGQRVGVTAEATDPLLDAIRAADAGVQSKFDEIVRLNDDEARFRRDNADAVERLSASGRPERAPPTPLFDAAGGMPAGDEAVARELERFRQRRAAIVGDKARAGDPLATEADILGELGMEARRLQSLAEQIGRAPTAGGRDTGAILAMRRSVREHQKRAAAILNQIEDREPLLKLRSALLSDEADRLRAVMRIPRALAGMDAAAAESGRVRALLASGPDGRSVMNADPAVYNAVAQDIAPLLDEYEDVTGRIVEAESRGAPSRRQAVAGEDIPALRQRAADIRAELTARTAPLRTGDLRPLEEIEESVRQSDRALMDAANRNLVAMSDEDAALAGSTVDAMHRAFGASIDASLATKASAIRYMSPEQKRVLELQRMFLGTEDPIVGASLLAPLSASAGNLFGNEPGAAVRLQQMIGARSRRLFGGPASEMSDAVRRYTFSSDAGARNAAMGQFIQMRRELGQIAAEHQASGRELELFALATAMVYKLRGGGFVRGRSAMTRRPTGFMRVLEEAANQGLLNDKLHPGLAEALERYAGRWSSMLDDFRDVLEPGRARRGYVPNIPTTPARAFMRRAAASGAEGAETSGFSRAKSKGVEAFEKPRSTDSAVFDSRRLGRTAEVFRGDRWVQEMSPAEVAAISDTSSRRWVEEMRAALDEYDSTPSRPPMLANDPWTINQLLKEGRFETLLGARDVPGGFMDTNFATLMAGSLMAHQRAVAREQFLEEVVGAAAVPIRANDIRKLANRPGVKVRLSNGLVGRIVTLPGGSGVRIGNDIFRPLSASVRSRLENPLIAAIGDEGRGAIYHQHVAELIEGAARTVESDGFWKAVDSITQAWKTVTLMHPSWWVGNVIGESINFAAQDPGFARAMTKYGRSAARMIRLARDPAALERITLDVAGSRVTGRQIVDLIRGEPVANADLFSEPGVQAIRGEFLPPSRMAGGVAAARPSALKSDFAASLAHQAAAARAPGWRRQIAAAGSVTSDRLNRYLREPWYRGNTRTSEYMRLIAYLSLRDQGVDHPAAVQRMIRAGFDYQRMTPAERNVFRRAIPFWSWLKNNSIYQAKLMMERPVYVGMLDSLQNAVEEAVNGEDRIPMNARPSWMREQLAVQFGADPESRSALIAGNLLPMENAFKLGQGVTGLDGVQDAVNWGVASVNPLFRGIFEIGAGREVFSGRTIGQTGDVTIPEYLRNQVRPIREVSRIAQTLGEQGVLPAVGRLALGGRIQPMTDDRIRLARLREFREEEERLRSTLRRAERTGDAPLRVVVNTNLLQLYYNMLGSGFTDEVPRWARERLASMRTTG